MALSLGRFAVGGFAVAGLMGLSRAPKLSLRSPATRIGLCISVLAALMLRLDGSHNHYFAAVALLAGSVAGALVPRRLLPASIAIATVGIMVWDGVLPWQLRHQPFEWHPFHSLIESPSVPLIATMAWKLFAWSTLAWAGTELGWKHRRTLLVPTGIAAAIELLQTVVASGNPDITDPLLAFLMAAIVILVHDPVLFPSSKDHIIS